MSCCSPDLELNLFQLLDLKGEFRDIKFCQVEFKWHTKQWVKHFLNVLQKWSRFFFLTRVVLCMPVLPVIRTLQILLRCVAISYWWSWMHLAAGQISHWLKSTISGLVVSCDDHIFLPGTQTTLFLLESALSCRVEAQKWRTNRFQVYKSIHENYYCIKNCTYTCSPLFIFHHSPPKNSGDRQQIQQNTEISQPTFDCTSRCIGVRNVTLQKRSHAAVEGGHLRRER